MRKQGTKKKRVNGDYKTSWDFTLLYKNDNDPQIERDMEEIERACKAFEKKYSTKDFTSTPSKLLAAFKDHDVLLTKISAAKPWWYFALRADSDSNDTKLAARSTQYEQRLTAATNRIQFFTLKIAAIPQSKHRALTGHSVLKAYKYSLEHVFRGAKHRLSEGEEQLSALLDQTSHTMWVNGGQKLLNERTILWKGKQIPVAQAIAIQAEQSVKDRRLLNTKINELLKAASGFSEIELNAVVNHKKMLDERRKFAQPYSESVLSYQNDDTTVENVVATVSKRFDISHRFFRLHAKLLGVSKAIVGDRGASIGTIKKKFGFAESVAIVKDAFSVVDPYYADLLDRFATSGQLDVYPKKGKRGGAYCWGSGKERTFLLLNHVDDVNSLGTLAHEMGHAIHTELSKQQPPRYQRYSTATAEVASTFFEAIVADDIEKKLSPREQIVFLHKRILDDIATIFRQVACFNFELELHERIRKEGQLSKEAMAQLLAKHLRSYMGDAVAVTDDDGYFFAYWSHIRNFFYVYTYAFGQIVSRALFEKWKADKSYGKKIEQFLSAGGSMSPEDIFASVGINVRDPKFFLAGLQGIEKDIDRLEKLAKKAWK